MSLYLAAHNTAVPLKPFEDRGVPFLMPSAMDDLFIVMETTGMILKSFWEIV